MKRYFNLTLHLIRISWQVAMEYRTNYIIWTIVDIGWTAIDLVFFAILVQNTGRIGNWNYGQTLIMAGFFRIMVVPVWGWMYESFSLLPRTISEGRLDYYLIKPASSQFLVSVRSFSTNLIPSIIGGLAFMAIGLSKSGIILTPPTTLLFLYLTFISTILMYGMYFSSVATSLYFDRLDNVQHIFTRLFDAARFPREIYSVSLQRLLTTILPLAIMLVVPVESLYRLPSIALVVQFHIISFFFLFLSHFVWNSGLRRYTSASS